jgi:hypothetical protein
MIYQVNHLSSALTQVSALGSPETIDVEDLQPIDNHSMTK